MKTQVQSLLPSAHLLVLFKPYFEDEKRMIDVVKRILELDYYKGIELGIFFDKAYREELKSLLVKDNIFLTVYATPYLKEKNLSLCSLEARNRRQAIDYLKELIGLASQMGCKNFGIPSGDDPGDELRNQALVVLEEAMVELADLASDYNMNIILEPLDRYVHKKQLIGPIEETIKWFKGIHEKAPNTYIHWDSAHEVLGGIDLIESLRIAKDFISSFHLCNAVLDPSHPYYGDWHMDVGVGPDFETEGFLKPEVASQIMAEVSSFNKVKGINDTYVSVEVLSHLGDDMWHKEKIQREFLLKSYELMNKEF